jgi:crotonobetainyl-CoA:carnitine CoA-transferase CaiB-like acyl-CoA transferase
MRMKIYSKTLAEWEEHFKEHPDVGMEVFRTPEEGLKHPQLLHNGQVMEFTDPRVGKTVQLAPVFKMSKTPGKVQGPAPDLGQHTKEVLGRLKGGAWKPSPRQVNGKVPARPLEGVTIVELALYYAAPFGPAALTDLGARVIKLEHPKGDDFRYSPQGPPEVPAVRVLQGKESVAVDLNFPEGQAIAHKIIEGADMLMTSWRGGMAKTLNMDHETLRRLNPNLIYVYGVGYGIDGPYAKRPAYAPTATAAIGGTRYQIGTAFPDVRGRKLTPEDIREIATYLQAGPGNADGVSAMTVGSAMLMGLVARQRLGIAQEVLTSMPCSTGHCCSAEMVQYDGKRPGQQVDPQLYGTDALNRLYETKEGWIVLAAQTQDNWRHFTEVVERLSSGTLVLRTDSRFANSSARQQNDHTLTHLLAGFFKEWSAAELEDAMLAHNVPCVKVETYSPAWYQTCGPAMLENGFVDEVVHPIFGRHPRMGPLVTMSLTPGISKPSPKVGQDTGRVLAECGYSEQDMDALESKGVIRRG